VTDARRTLAAISGAPRRERYEIVSVILGRIGYRRTPEV
jgi:hypothetical protein